MSARLEQLYQQTILDHNRTPRNFGDLPDCTHQAHGKNPLCGDDYFVYAIIRDGVIVDVRFTGTGCAISKSSASMMTEVIKGQKVSDVILKKEAFLHLLTGDQSSVDTTSHLGKLVVFEGVKKYPARVKCAALAWRALEAVLTDTPTDVTTE